MDAPRQRILDGNQTQLTSLRGDRRKDIVECLARKSIHLTKVALAGLFGKSPRFTLKSDFHFDLQRT
jgi:hypothetical protein